MMEFKQPIPVIVENDKEGYAIYVSNSGTLTMNIIWLIIDIIGFINYL